MSQKRKRSPRKTSSVRAKSGGRRGRRQKTIWPKRPSFKRVSYSVRRTKDGRISRRGSVVEKYTALYRLQLDVERDGPPIYKRVTTIREKVRGRLVKFRTDKGIGKAVKQGLYLKDKFQGKNFYSTFKKNKIKGFVVKVRGRTRGAKRDTTRTMKIFLEPGDLSRKDLADILTARVMSGLKSMELRLSSRDVTKNPDFTYLRNPEIQIDYYA